MPVPAGPAGPPAGAGGPARQPPYRSLATAISSANLAQIVLALAVAAIVQLHLRSVAFTPIGESGYGVVRGSCLMGRSFVHGSICYYAYTVAAASIFASFSLSLIRCARLGVGPWLEVAAATGQAAWWAAGAAVFSAEAARAATEGLPARGWRTLVVLLAWVEAGLFVGLLACYASLARRVRGAAVAAAAGGGGGGGAAAAVAAGNGWWGFGGFGGPAAAPPPQQQQQPEWGGVQMGPVPMAYAAHGAPPPPPQPQPPPLPPLVAWGVAAAAGGGGAAPPAGPPPPPPGAVVGVPPAAAAAAAAAVATPPPPPVQQAPPGGNPFAPQP